MGFGVVAIFCLFFFVCLQATVCVGAVFTRTPGERARCWCCVYQNVRGKEATERKHKGKKGDYTKYIPLPIPINLRAHTPKKSTNLKIFTFLGEEGCV